jgi:hypothetical protein
VDDLEVAIGVDEDFVSIQTHEWFELAQGVGARLKNAPELPLLKTFVFFLPSQNLLLESHLGILEDGVYLVRSRAEAVEHPRFDLHGTDDVLLRALLDLFPQLLLLILEQNLACIRIFLEQVCILVLLVQQNDPSRFLSDLLVLLLNGLHEAACGGVGGGVSHVYNGLNLI